MTAHALPGFVVLGWTPTSQLGQLMDAMPIKAMCSFIRNTKKLIALKKRISLKFNRSFLSISI